MNAERAALPHDAVQQERRALRHAVGRDEELLKLVDDQRGDVAQERIALQVGGQDPFGDDEQRRAAREVPLEADVPSHFAANGPAALLRDAPILILDEATSALDPETTDSILELYRRINEELGLTVLLITHEMDIAEYGTRFVRFRDGKVVLDQAITKRRNAEDELAALPPPDADTPMPESDHPRAPHADHH
mgnify:CR=1 FL=1